MTIYKRLKAAGVIFRKKWDHKTLSVSTTNLSNHHKQILEGCLLGDGSVFCPKITSYFELTSIHEEFANHLQEVLPFEKSKVGIRDRQKTTIHGIEYNCKKSYVFKTLRDNSLADFRKKWYPQGIKIIPKDLKLSPNTIKYWFYGDGSTSWIKYKNINRYLHMTFCTNNFTIEDCELLKSKLDDLGFKFEIYLQRKQPVLITSKTNIVKDILNYMGECSINAFDYKWKTLLN